MQKQAIWTTEYEINTLLLNPHQRLGLVGLLNLLQDTAWEHATHLGHGHRATLDKGLIWVLTRQKLRMSRWPRWHDRIRVRTWVRPIEGPFASRDFEIHMGDEKIGESTTSWLTLDIQTRRPKKVDITEAEMPFRADGALDLTTEKIEFRKEFLENAEIRSEFRVRNSDLDLNGHVNNTRYAQWVLDAVPFESHRNHVVGEYEVCFLAETHAGDEIEVQGGRVGSPDELIQFQGFRKSDQKPVFTSRLRPLPIGAN